MTYTKNKIMKPVKRTINKRILKKKNKPKTRVKKKK